MMQFYKKRDFGELISDTFLFFKVYGKNYFKNFIIVNGIFIVLTVIFMLLFYKNLFGQMAGTKVNGQTYLFEEYFQDNPVLLSITIVVVVVFLLVFMLVSYSFPVLYIKRLSDQLDDQITADQIFGDLKKIIPKFLIFLLGLLFVIFPIVLILFGLSALLMMIIIGFFILIFIMPVIFNVVNFTFFDYYHTDRGFFNSLGYAIRSQFSYKNALEGSPFWKYWGSTAIIFLIYYVLGSAITMIPMFILTGSFYTLPPEDATNPNKIMESLGVLFFVIYGVSTVFNMLLINLVYACSGLQYYDSRTDLHRKVDLMEIETIGEKGDI